MASNGTVSATGTGTGTAAPSKFTGGAVRAVPFSVYGGVGAVLAALVL
jgi:hypothetical protein